MDSIQVGHTKWRFLTKSKAKTYEVCHEINYYFEEDPFKNPFDLLTVDIQYTGLQIQLLVRNEAYLHKNKEKVFSLKKKKMLFATVFGTFD